MKISMYAQAQRTLNESPKVLSVLLSAKSSSFIQAAPFGAWLAHSASEPKGYFHVEDDMAKGKKLAPAKKMEKKQTLHVS